MGDNSNLRIKDIANLAQVSEGTVDRVLHNRGNVSAVSREKVERVLRELNYSPNIFASALASKRKAHLIVSLLPSCAVSNYWSSVRQGILEATEELKPLNLVLKEIYFDQYNSDSFVEMVGEVLALNPQGVIFSPIFSEESKQFLRMAKEREIGVTILDSYIESSNFISYIGQDGYLSGRVIAKVLSMQLRPESEIMVFVSQRNDSRVSNQFSLRYGGFMEYLAGSVFKDVVVHRVELPFYDERVCFEIIRENLEINSMVKAMVVFNSRCYVVGNALKELGVKDIVVAGYDTLAQSVESMREGYVSTLIGTQPRLQGYRATKSLCESVILRQKVNRINFIPSDILFADNVDNYINFDFK